MQTPDILKNMDTKPERSEGFITKAVEAQTTKLPSIFFLSFALAAMGVSASLVMTEGRAKGWANFFGHWAPSILILGLYNKLTKVEGSEGRTVH